MKDSFVHPSIINSGDYVAPAVFFVVGRGSFCLFVFVLNILVGNHLEIKPYIFIIHKLALCVFI